MDFDFTLLQFLFSWELALDSLESLFFGQLWIPLHQSVELHLWIIEIDANDGVAHVFQDPCFEEERSIKNYLGLTFSNFQVHHFVDDVSENAPVCNSVQLLPFLWVSEDDLAHLLAVNFFLAFIPYSISKNSHQRLLAPLIILEQIM